ncbi:MAG TPA: GAF and ANTAR domain-containing protein [Acidimicrobiales bacterium]|jgi:GAF domain-containing protein|nr:GAF and ANTAR domain-containing protein [Acidimicrobiales bacterium]
MARETMLARALVELADSLVSDFDVTELLTVLTDHCIDVLDVAAAGIMLASPAGDLRVMASSSEEMRLLELFELQSQEGPCLDCYNTGQPVVNIDLAGDDPRWPQFAQRATAGGFRAVHALPMRLRGSVLGALNMFHVDTGRMRPADVAAAQALADVATIAILQHRAAAEAKLLNEQLSEALNTRIVIEQAKGMIAQQRGVGMEAAFTGLRDHARTHNLRLTDVARDVIDGHQDLATPDHP